jgi:hypothetical protein
MLLGAFPTPDFFMLFRRNLDKHFFKNYSEFHKSNTQTWDLELKFSLFFVTKERKKALDLRPTNKKKLVG